jgi:hypothetical protein
VLLLQVNIASKVMMLPGEEAAAGNQKEQQQQVGMVMMTMAIANQATM